MTHITERACLARLSISVFIGRRFDRQVSAEVASLHNTTEDAGRYNKVIIARSALSEINQVAGAARAHHYKMTLPWMDDGARILPSANFLDYSEEMRKFHNAFDAKVAEFIEAHPDLIEEARGKLGTMFSESDYPSAADVRRKFAFDVPIMPLPSAQDFRVDAPGIDAPSIQADIERRTQQALDAAVRDVYERIRDTVGKMAEKLRAYDKAGGKVKHPFRDSLVENVRELVGMVPKLNITNDAGLSRMADMVENELCQHDADQLRDSADLRLAVATEADRLLDQMAEYFAD